MQHLENDMEELFKKAGENYAPQEGRGDWENVVRQIINQSAIKASELPVKNRRNRVIIILFLVLSLVSTGVFILKDKIEHKKFGDQEKSQQAVNNQVDKLHKVEAKRGKVNSSGRDIGFVSSPKKKEVFRCGIKPVDSFAGALPKKAAAADLLQPADTYNAWHKENRKSGRIPEEIQPENRYLFALPLQKHSTYDQLDNTRNELKILPGEAGTPALRQSTKKENTNTVQKGEGIYVGFIVAPDFSKVHSPSFRNTGFGAGFVAGGKIKAGLSLESGVIWNKKIYSSEGKNFSMDNVRAAMPAGMIINNLESKSSLIEIPVKIRYDFARVKAPGFFITGGVSSYIMTKEKNNYNVTFNGNVQKLSGIYKKNIYSLPAVAGISIGYSHYILGQVEIRAEPFLKVPLKGIGVGSLPVTSAGVQFGITSRVR